MMEVISSLSNRATAWAGSPSASLAALISLLLYLVLGCVYRFSDQYQLVANTIMSAVSYLMLFLLQHSQNHCSLAMQLKIDELILKLETADNRLIGIEDLTEQELNELVAQHRRYRAGGLPSA